MAVTSQSLVFMVIIRVCSIKCLALSHLPIINKTVYYTGRFIMFSAITNIYNKETKGPILMELFIATGKLIFFCLGQLEMFDVCTTGNTAHIDNIIKLLPHTGQHVDACVAAT